MGQNWGSVGAAPAAAYGGVTMIELPRKVSDNRVLTSSESYVTEPSVTLVARPAPAVLVLILAGHPDEALAGLHRVDRGEVI